MIFASIQNTHFPESGSEKHFQASEMRAIDSPHKITPRKMILRQETQNFSIFASIHTYISLNQGQGSIFKLRECAQSIFRLEITLKSRFLEENRKKISRWNALLLWFSGSRLIFHASKMRAIDFSPRNYPKKSVFRKKSEKNFFSIFRE